MFSFLARVLARGALSVRRKVGGLERLPLSPSTWLVLVVTLTLGFLPLFSRPSYESALLFGLLLPPIAGVSAAVSVRPMGAFEPQLLQAMRRGLVHATVLTAVLSLHAMRGGWCAPGHDLLLLFLGPVLGIVTAASIGSYAGVIVCFSARARHRRWLRVTAGVAGPFAGIVAGVVDFYGSPSVFAFDQFVGFFAGSPYDTGFDPTPRLVTFRLGTAGLLLVLWALARHIEWDAEGRFVREQLLQLGPRWRIGLGRRVDRAVALVGCFGLVCFTVITAHGERLGHRSSTEFIRKSLTQAVVSGRCEVVASPREKRLAVDRLAKDCDAWLIRLERRLGTAPLRHVTAFVFENPAQKEILMGAAHTQIAKPWRREIYLNGAHYPDDVVGHELAHIVGGQVARGPFKVAGSLGGWLPNPGLIEGLAVALAPDEDGDMTALEWSQALRSIGRLPQLSQLFSLGFLQHSGPLAYTVAGAFVEWLGSEYGKVAVRRWYAGESLERATGRDFATLEQEFHRRLDATPLPPLAKEAALAKFARPGVYSRHCPHAVDRSLAEADQKLAAGDATNACRLYDEARKLDATELRARFGLGECLVRQTTVPNNVQQAQTTFRSVADDPEQPLPVRQRALERVADLLLGQGALAPARRIYDELAGSTFESDRRRILDVKRRAKSQSEVRAVETLLLGASGETAWDVAVLHLGRWSAESTSDGTADYLLGRNFWSRGREAVAIEHLDRAIERGLPTPELLAEALRQRTIAACATGESALAASLAERLALEPGLPTPRRLGIQSLVERCSGRFAGNDWPERALPTDSPRRAPAASAPATASSPPVELPYDSEDFVCPEGMQKIRGSSFHVGSSRTHADPEQFPRFETRVRGFCLDRTEVTVAAYLRCVAAGKCRPALGRSANCNARHPDRLDHPINCVDHEQATRFCNDRGARLPTEIEWEFAARGGASHLTYPWGEASPDGRACWKAASSCRVATYAAGAYGLYDMSGNVWEWTASDFGAYPWSTPLAGDFRLKVYRGGGWSRRFEKWMQLGLRNRADPGDQGAHLGFRCASSPENLSCPFERDAQLGCLFGVLRAECRVGKPWNGQRCAAAGAPLCPEGHHVEPGQGCVRDLPMVIKRQAPDFAGVQRRRSPEFDSDCRRNQAKRPLAFRYSGGSHEARNLASMRAGCKNRDVGAGWNSTCCP